jgi:Kef-type K+ transport system membrane component KefB
MISDFSFTIPDLHQSLFSNEFLFLKEIGILFLLFISGLEISISKLKKTEKASTLVAIGGVLVPLVLGFSLGFFLGFTIQESIIIGLILTATSVGVTVRTLMDLRVLDTNVGATVIGSAVIDDVIGLILLLFVLGIESLMDAVLIGVRIALFFLIFLYLGLKVIDKILEIGEKIHLPKAFLSISISILLVYSFFADKAGISGIIGAFVAGLIIGQNVRSTKISDDVKAIGFGLFIPIFFIWVGSTLWQYPSIETSALPQLLIIAVTVIIISIIGKIIGCGIGAKVSGMNWRESIQIGVGMIPRMELAIIIATAAISHGIFISGIHEQQILITTILMTIVTTLLAPVLIKATFKNSK